VCSKRSNILQEKQCIGNGDCCHGSRYAGLILWDIHTEINGEGLRDRMFEMEFVAILRCALDKKAYVRSSAITILTAAIAHSATTSVCGVFILKYLQMAFGTRYSILRLSPHLYIHCMMNVLISGGVQ